MDRVGFITHEGVTILRVDLSGPASVEEMKHYSAFNTPFVKASAVVGISGLARIIYDAAVKVIGGGAMCPAG